MAGQFFPKIVRERCHPSVPSASCNGRRRAVRNGEFFWSFEEGGWVFTLNPLRTMRNWETVYRAGQNTNGRHYVLEICPFCGSALPELTMPGLIGDGQCDGNSD